MGSKKISTYELIRKMERDTEKAYAVENPNGKPGSLIFLPKSQIESIDGSLFEMPEWLAEEKGIENTIMEN